MSTGTYGFSTTMDNQLAAEPEKASTHDSDVPLQEKVRFLRTPGAYPHAPATVEANETHMSWVFLAGDLVYKLKKPVRYPFLDFTTLSSREANCREELRLNQRLALDTYLRVVALTKETRGGMALGGAGDVVDWLVVMRRLPADRMLDRMISENRVPPEDLDSLTDVLARFYRGADRVELDPEVYADRFMAQQSENRGVLTQREFGVGQGRILCILDMLDARLRSDRRFLNERARNSRIVEAHGDLRPEHICLTEPIAIFDCLEFSRELRLLDPFDELAFLGMECRLLGNPSLGPGLVARLGLALEDTPPPRLLCLYTAFRAVLRARLSLAHLLDPIPREPSKWEPLASRYLALAEEALS